MMVRITAGTGELPTWWGRADDEEAAIQIGQDQIALWALEETTPEEVAAAQEAFAEDARVDLLPVGGFLFEWIERSAE